jgi:hypothetical protein
VKLRTLAVTAITGLFAVSLAYAAPTTTLTADDSSALAMNDAAPAVTDGATNAGDNIGSVQSNDMTQLSDNSSNSDTNLALDNSNNSDDISADTATGDDDY